MIGSGGCNGGGGSGGPVCAAAANQIHPYILVCTDTQKHKQHDPGTIKNEIVLLEV